MIINLIKRLFNPLYRKREIGTKFNADVDCDICFTGNYCELECSITLFVRLLYRLCYIPP